LSLSHNLFEKKGLFIHDQIKKGKTIFEFMRLKEQNIDVNEQGSIWWVKNVVIVQDTWISGRIKNLLKYE
jgi:hypothetical protein